MRGFQLVLLACLLGVIAAEKIPIFDAYNQDASEPLANLDEEPTEMRFQEAPGTNPDTKNKTTPATQPTTIPVKPNYDVPCDIEAERGICLFNGRKVLVPDAVDKSLIAYYKFDEAHPLDSSSRSHHPVSSVPAGPGRGGFGSSGRFDGDVWLQVNANDDFQRLDNVFTISFWLYTSAGVSVDGTVTPASVKCPLVVLGGAKRSNSIASVSFNPKSRHLHVTAAQTSASVKTRSRLASQSWYHISVVRSPGSVTVFINGVLDTSTTFTEAKLTYNAFELFAGRTPTPIPQCSVVRSLIDDLKIYSRSLQDYEIQAETGSIGNVEPNFIRYGCTDCNFATASSKCDLGYHLCYQTELDAGAYGAALSLGWVNWQTPVWANDLYTTTSTHNGPETEKKTGLCCLG